MFRERDACARGNVPWLVHHDRPRANREPGTVEAEGRLRAAVSPVLIDDTYVRDAAAAVLRHGHRDDLSTADIGEDRALLCRIAAADRHEVPRGAAGDRNAGQVAVGR